MPGHRLGACILLPSTQDTNSQSTCADHYNLMLLIGEILVLLVWGKKNALSFSLVWEVLHELLGHSHVLLFIFPNDCLPW